MKLIPASYEILECPDDVLLKIERAARTCYKSEERTAPGSAEKLVRKLLRRSHSAMLEFGGWLCVRFVSNRGFTHEMVRHRLASFAQESTRYCNYGKDKHGGEVTFIEPIGLNDAGRCATLKSWRLAESTYLSMVAGGFRPQLARDVLPIGVKTEIVVGANTREWRHIFGQRCSKAAHPRMHELMVPLLLELRKRIPILYDDVVVLE